MSSRMESHCCVSSQRGRPAIVASSVEPMGCSPQCEAPSLARLVTCPGCTPCEHVDLVQQVASQELVELDLDELVELVPGRSWRPKSHQPSFHLLQRCQSPCIRRGPQWASRYTR